jgi:hypothetical protein
LVNTVRTPGANHINPQAAIGEYIRDINATVQDIVSKTNEAIYDLKDTALSKHAPPVIKVLENSAAELVRLNEGNKGKDSLPPIAFRIARATKVCLSSCETSCLAPMLMICGRNSYFASTVLNRANLQLKCPCHRSSKHRIHQDSQKKTHGRVSFLE